MGQYSRAWGTAKTFEEFSMIAFLGEYSMIAATLLSSRARDHQEHAAGV
jgi:hypothetical protein